MASNFNPTWYFGDDPALTQQTRDGLKQLMQYVWSLRDQQASLNQTVQNFNNNITQTVTKVVTSVVAANNGNNNATGGLVIFGTYANRLSLSPSIYANRLYVETDRFQACYYSNGAAWVLIEAAGAGSFELRYTGLNSYDQGFEWYETSRNNVAGLPPFVLYRWSGSSWDYQEGEFYRNQNALATLAGTMGTNGSNDLGALVNVVDFAGQLQWQNNNTWSWGPQDDGSHGEMRIREVDPTGGWWHLYDGSTNVTYLQANGNIGSVNLANLTSAANVAFLEFGNNSSGNSIDSAVAPTFTGNAASGSVSVSLNSSSGTFSTGGNNTASALTSVSVLSAGFSGNNVSGTVSNNGQPPSIVRRAWFRR